MYRRRYCAAEIDPQWADLHFVRLRSQAQADAFLEGVGSALTKEEKRIDLELGGKAVLIAGGTDGLGLALAKRLAEEGASVAVCGRDPSRVDAAGPS